MGAAEFQDYDNPHQRAIFCAMLPEQRAMLWEKHLSDILELEWNNTEREHINKLYLYIKNNHHIFNDNLDEKKNDEIAVYLFRWKDYALKKLKWSNKTLFYMIANLEPVYKDNKTSELTPYLQKVSTKNIQRIKRKKKEGANPTTNCGCSTASKIDWCAVPNQKEYCKAGHCRTKRRGCGTLLGYSCDGLCTLDGL